MIIGARPVVVILQGIPCSSAPWVDGPVLARPYSTYNYFLLAKVSASI
jgi:hypothetical protein